MKSLRISLATIIAAFTLQSASAQSSKAPVQQATNTQSIKVYGECGMCKKRIETAAKTVAGVKYAVWDEKTEDLVIKYNPSKRDVADEVQKKITAAGHDTEKYYATEAAYQNLPGCCHYDRRPIQK